MTRDFWVCPGVRQNLGGERKKGVIKYLEEDGFAIRVLHPMHSISRFKINISITGAGASTIELQLSTDHLGILYMETQDIMIVIQILEECQLYMETPPAFWTLTYVNGWDISYYAHTER